MNTQHTFDPKTIELLDKASKELYVKTLEQELSYIDLNCVSPENKETLRHFIEEANGEKYLIWLKENNMEESNTLTLNKRRLTEEEELRILQKRTDRAAMICMSTGVGGFVGLCLFCAGKVEAALITIGIFAVLGVVGLAINDIVKDNKLNGQ